MALENKIPYADPLLDDDKVHISRTWFSYFQSWANQIIAGVVQSITGTAGRILVTGTPVNPIINLDPAYVANAAQGGTGQSNYLLGDTLYASGSAALAKLPGITPASRHFLSQTGTGAASAAPAWTPPVSALASIPGRLIRGTTTGDIAAVGGQIILQDGDSLSALVAAVGSTPVQVTVCGQMAITANLVTPPTMAISAPKCASPNFAISTGVTLTINGAFEAGSFTVFTGAGTATGLRRVNAMWYGATNDGVDSTAAILLAAGAGTREVFVPYSVKFNIKTLLRSLPDTVVVEDRSVINDYSAANETAKSTGLISSDTAEKDTHNRIISGHHVIIQLNNFGTSGTASGDEGKASTIWCYGQFDLGSTDKRGFRGILIDQYTRETGGAFWKQVVRSIAPWVAIGGHHLAWASGQSISGAGIRRSYSANVYTSTGAGTTGATPPTHTTGSASDGGVTWTYETTAGNYELWATGQAVAVGDFRYTGTNHYIAATAGTCGATEPSHTSGTASDGTVSWTWVDTSDRSLYSIDEYGRVLIGSGSGTDAISHKIGATDLGGTYAWWGAGQVISGAAINRRWGNNLYTSTGAGTTGTTPPTHTAGTVSDGTVSWTWVSTGASYIAQFWARGISKDVLFRFNATDSAGTETLLPYLRATVGTGLRIPNSTSTLDLAVFDDAAGATIGKLNLRGRTAVDGDTTPDISGYSTLYLSNTSPTSITGLDNGSGSTGTNDQFVELIFTNSNTTLVHSSTLMLSGFVDVTPGTYSSIAFRKVQSTFSDRWIEVRRKINPVLGTPVQVLASEATNSDPSETVVQNRLATTDATVTTLHTFTVPASTTYAIEATVIARRTGGAGGTAEDGARYKLSAVYKNVAGTATLIGAATIAADEDQAGWDCAFSPSSGTVRIQVTGAVDNNITWHITARTYAVSS